jgi:hypothetical protein
VVRDCSLALAELLRGRVGVGSRHLGDCLKVRNSLVGDTYSGRECAIYLS